MGFIWSSVQVLTSSSSSPRFICFHCLFAREVKQALRQWKRFRIKEQYFLFFLKKKALFLCQFLFWKKCHWGEKMEYEITRPFFYRWCKPLHSCTWSIHLVKWKICGKCVHGGAYLCFFFKIQFRVHRRCQVQTSHIKLQDGGWLNCCNATGLNLGGCAIF